MRIQKISIMNFGPSQRIESFWFIVFVVGCLSRSESGVWRISVPPLISLTPPGTRWVNPREKGGVLACDRLGAGVSWSRRSGIAAFFVFERERDFERVRDREA